MPGDEYEVDDRYGAPAPRQQRARRTLLDEILMEGDPEGLGGTSTMGPGGTIELGELVDANAPLRDDPETEARQRMLGGTRGVGRAGGATAAAAEEAGAASTEAARPLLPLLQEPSRRERQQLADEMRGTTALGDAVSAMNPLDEGGGRAAERSRERLRNLWDQITLGTEGLGGRNPLQPIVGRDVRNEAAIAGIGDVAGLGVLENIGGAVRGALTDETYEQARDDLRQRSQRAQAQAPEAFGTGQIAGAGMLAAVPGGGAAEGAGLVRGALQASRVPAALGAVSALGHSDIDPLEDPTGAAQTAVAGGLEGGALGALGQVGARGLQGLARGPSAGARALAERSAQRLAQQADEAIQQQSRAAMRQGGAEIGQFLGEMAPLPFGGRIGRKLGELGGVAAHRAAQRALPPLEGAVQRALEGVGPRYPQRLQQLGELVGQPRMQQAARGAGQVAAPTMDRTEARPAAPAAEYEVDERYGQAPQYEVDERYGSPREESEGEE